MKIKVIKQKKYYLIFCILLISGIVGAMGFPNYTQAAVYGEPEPIQEPEPTPDQKPTPIPEPIPDPEQIPKPEQPAPKPEPIKEPEPIQETKPVQESKPTPAPENKPAPKPSTTNYAPKTEKKSQSKINTNESSKKNTEVGQKSPEIVNEVREQPTTNENEIEDSTDLKATESIDKAEETIEKENTEEKENENLLNTAVNNKKSMNEKSSPFSSDRVIFSVFSILLIGGMVFYWIRKRSHR